jgi:hypothetical protein
MTSGTLVNMVLGITIYIYIYLFIYLYLFIYYIYLFIYLFIYAYNNDVLALISSEFAKKRILHDFP